MVGSGLGGIEVIKMRPLQRDVRLPGPPLFHWHSWPPFGAPEKRSHRESTVDPPTSSPDGRRRGQTPLRAACRARARGCSPRRSPSSLLHHVASYRLVLGSALPDLPDR